MARVTEILLGLAILTLLPGLLINFGFINVDGAPGLDVLFPVGVTFLGLFLIGRLIEPEVATFDAEHRAPPTQGPRPQAFEPDTFSAGHRA